MNQNTDILHEAKRLRLLAAALELQHHTSTAANVVQIPGGDQMIAIGTPAQLRALLADNASERCPHCDDTGDVHRPDGTWAGTCTCPAGVAAPAIDAAAICDGVAAKSKNSLFRSGAKICAGEIRAAQLTHCAAGRDGECGHAQCPQLRDNEPRSTGRHCPLDSEGGHHD